MLTKEKGTQDPYIPVDIATFAAGGTLPKIDMSVSWKFHEDRPPRRSVASPARRNESTRGSPPHPASRQKPTGQMSTTRQHSQSDQNTGNKKIRMTEVGSPPSRKSDVEAEMDTQNSDNDTTL